jgi:hypothetical protein
MDRLVRLMIVKARCGCGYESPQVIGDATRPTASKRRFVVRAAGIDSTVVETDAQSGNVAGRGRARSRANEQGGEDEFSLRPRNSHLHP